MDPATPELQNRPRAYLSSVTLLLALTLSVRAIDVACAVPNFRPLVTHAVVRLFTGSAPNHVEHRPACEPQQVRSLLVVASVPQGVIPEAPELRTCREVRLELIDLPPPLQANA